MMNFMRQTISRQNRRLPPLTEHRLRRLRVRLPLDVTAFAAGIPFARLSRFELGKEHLSPAQLARLEAFLDEQERVTAKAEP